MIEGMGNSINEQAVIAQLSNSGIQFYLTGSRRAQCARLDSDWDFFVIDLPHVRKVLESIGFVSGYDVLAPKWYGDPSLVLLYTRMDGINIHVQTISPLWFNAKVAANNIICAPLGVQKRLYQAKESLKTYIPRDAPGIEHRYKIQMRDIWSLTLREVQGALS